MDPESTTTIGEGESLTTERPFHIMNAVESTSAKFRTCAASCRGCMPVTPSMLRVWGECEGGGRCDTRGWALRYDCSGYESVATAGLGVCSGRTFVISC
jgi:hypothetical protein